MGLVIASYRLFIYLISISLLDNLLEKSIVFIYFHNFKSSNLTSFDQGGREFDVILAERIAE